MEIEQEVVLEPVSPTGQYLNSSIISLCVIGVLESQVPINDSQAIALLKDVFLPINPRFSSIMVMIKNGEKRWKKVEVKLTDHVKFPVFPPGMSTEFYDNCLDDYISKIAMEQLPQNQPLWEIHIIKYPTSNAAGNLIFKLHHALGDGFSLMGALLSCLQRADDPAIPLAFPSVQLRINEEGKKKEICRLVPEFFSAVYNTASDFLSAIVKGIFVEDDLSPIRSGHHGVEFLPVSTVTMHFSIDLIKQIKTKLGVTLNDVICGTIFLGIRMYMESMSKGSGKARATSLVLLNTRMAGGYKSVEDMIKPNAELPWGNHFAFLPVPIPKLSTGPEVEDPLQFVWKARKVIQRKRNSFALILTAKYLQFLKKFRGPEAVSKFIHATLKNTSIGITNLIGPIDQMALADHPVKGLYFVVSGAPQSLMTGIISYMGKLRVAALVEKDFIDPQKFKAYVENAFDLIFKAACGAPSKN